MGSAAMIAAEAGGIAGHITSLGHEPLHYTTFYVDVDDVAAYLEKAKSLGAKTPRERDYIQALSVFYADTDKLDHNQRAEAYAKAMHGVYERNPQDREAGVFYALSLLLESFMA